MSNVEQRAPRSIDEFLSLLERCENIEDLFKFYQDEMEREGYQNVVFGRLGARADTFELPYGNIPEGVTRAYFEDRLWVDDPILAASQTMARPFTWIDEMLRKTHSAAAWNVMEQAIAHGVRGGMTMPFHRPGGWDLISLSMRDERLLNAERISIVNIKSYATVQRYIALEEAALADKQTRDAETSPRAPGCDHSQKHHQHGQGSGVIQDDECRVMVLVDIAWRRYCAGLVRLSERVPEIVGEHKLRECVDRGLIQEEADDDNFRYVFKASPVGQSHIKLCPRAPALRNEIWQTLVEVGEIPRV